MADITSNLVGYWKFEEGRGTTTADSSGNGLTGTLTAATWAAGRGGSALSFDGATAFVTVSDNAVFNVTDYSLFAWIKTATVSIGIIAEQVGATQDKGLYVNSDGHLHGFARYTGSGQDDDGLGVVNDNVWHHVGITRSSVNQNRIYYVDGVVVNTVADTQAGANNPGASFVFGARTSSGPFFFFPGLMDEIRLYNKVLSLAEVKWLYVLGTNKPGSLGRTLAVGDGMTRTDSFS